MTRPLTCLTLIAAAGAGLYLYQEKHRAQVVDQEINRTVHATEQMRDRVGMMRAEWALLNEPDRLAGLAAPHLASLQTMTPGQFAHIDDLATRLPPVGAPTAPPAAIEPETPIAAATPTAPVQMAQIQVKPVPQVVAPVAKPDPIRPAPAVVMAQNARPDPVRHTALPFVAQSGPGTVLAVRPVTPLMVQATIPTAPAARTVHVAAAKPRETEPVYRAVYAPVVQAYASRPPVQIHAPSVQQASASSYGEAAPFVGSALGMARTSLPAPIPVGSSQSR